ncbi:MAG: hypothetical protein AAFQ14_14985 [Cyanobacteria bacterium J06621_12]
MNSNLAEIEDDPDRYLLNLKAQICFAVADLFGWILCLMARILVYQTAVGLAPLLTRSKCLEQLRVEYPKIAVVLLISAFTKNHDCRLGVTNQIYPYHFCFDYSAKPSLFQSWVQAVEKSYFCLGVNPMQ